LEPRAPTVTAAADGGLRAVAIVGDVGGGTGDFIDDMEQAVDALQSHGVSVTEFYYGATSFTWGDIVAAAQGAHILLYMGHGVYGWGSPNNFGGFYLGDDKFVSPSMIRTDLDGVLASDAVIIFSHACFTAGSSGIDSGVVSQQEAEARVRSYAEPFVDIGIEAYFANNYFGSAAGTVNALLSDYDLWLDKCAYAENWNLSFVGIPDYVFQGGTCSWADFDCDGSVDDADVQAVADAWRCKQGQACYRTEFDSDLDGVITVVDITRVAAE
jgi:hypothetical protein